MSTNCYIYVTVAYEIMISPLMDGTNTSVISRRAALQPTACVRARERSRTRLFLCHNPISPMQTRVVIEVVLS